MSKLAWASLLLVLGAAHAFAQAVPPSPPIIVNGSGGGGGGGSGMATNGSNSTSAAAQNILTNSGATPLTVGGAFKIGGSGGVGITYNNNELVLDANKSFAVSGTGSFQVNQSLGGPLISSDSNDTVTITSVSPQANTNLVVQPGIAGGTVFMGVNAQSGTNEERLVIGSQGHGSHYLFGQVVLGAGSCQPVDFLNDISVVGFTLTCTPNLRLPNNTAMVGRNAANSADLAILKLNASNQVELGFGAVTTLFPSLISSASSQVQIGESGGNGVLNINGQGVSSAAYNFLSSAGDLYINRATGKTIHFRENNGTDQLTIAPTTGALSAHTISPAANTVPLTISGGSITGSSTVTLGPSITGTLNTSGIVVGALFFGNVTNTASGAGSTLMDLQVGSVSKFKVDIGGAITSASTITATNGFVVGASNTIQWLTSGSFIFGNAGSAGTAGAFRFVNGTANPPQVNFGGDTASFPALRRNATAINFRLADNSADAPITAAGAAFSAPILPQGYLVSTLPASPGTGAVAYVTDAVACTFLATLTGGSSTYCPVTYNGAAWVGG